MTKDLFQDQVKIPVEIFLSSKKTEYLMRRIGKILYKLGDVIKTNGEYTID